MSAVLMLTASMAADDMRQDLASWAALLLCGCPGPACQHGGCRALPLWAVLCLHVTTDAAYSPSLLMLTSLAKSCPIRLPCKWKFVSVASHSVTQAAQALGRCRTARKPQTSNYLRATACCVALLLTM